RWSYPHHLGSRDFDERQEIFARYLTDNWRAFRTWGLSANSPWEYQVFWKLRDGVARGRRDFKADWERLPRPGFSRDYTHGRQRGRRTYPGRSGPARQSPSGRGSRNGFPYASSCRPRWPPEGIN